MDTYKTYVKVFASMLLIVVCVSFHSCTTQEAITPQHENETTNTDVLKKIKSLGFADHQIKETPDYYLADGDLYFSKKKSVNATALVKKSGRPISKNDATLTIHLDKSLAGVIDEHWRAGIDQAITEWNANEQVHFHFAFTNSADANINIVMDSDLPKDLAIASEFPEGSRTGSNIRINVATTKVVDDTKQAFMHALEHCVGFLHSTSTKNKDVKVNRNSLKSAHGPRYIWELYAIQGDVLYRIDVLTGAYYAVATGWSGTEVMGQMDGLLYMVQFGWLWAVDPSTGDYNSLTNGWEGSQYITNLGSKLYILQDSWIWPVDPNTGLWDANLGQYTLARGLVGFTDGYNGKNKLAVLRRKPGSSTVSLIYFINPSNGALFVSTTVPASGVAGWNGNFLLTSSDPHIVEIFNGKLSFASPLGSTGQYPDSRWPNAELVTAVGSVLFVINNGTLYRVDTSVPWGTPPPTDGVQNAKRLGKLRDWTNTSCLLFLE